jgi:predicted Mrr-cat superfamily restriction endonuclease
MGQQAQQAFILRINVSTGDRVPEAIQRDQLIIGWANASGLLDPNLDWGRFREIISHEYYSEETNLRRAGSAAGNMWRFIRDMKPGDIIVVPHGSKFYVGEVNGQPLYDESKIEDDSAYRRPANWLNDKKPIPRSLAKSALISRMKAYQTCADATGLLDEIKECLLIAKGDKAPSFESDLKRRLIRETLDEIRGGRMDSYRFERLVQDVLNGLGAQTTKILARGGADKGADIFATFQVAGVFSQVVAIQAKHWKPDPPVGRDVVEQLIRGIENKEAGLEAGLGMIITSGTIGLDATEKAKEYTETTGIRIELIDGEQLAKLIVERGLR